MKSKGIIIYSFLIIILTIIPFIIYFSKFHGNLSNDPAAWGNFGSYAGGVLTSIFSSLSLIFVIWSFIETKRNNNETQKNNIEQQRLIADEQTTAKFNIICNKLSDCFKDKHYYMFGIWKPKVEFYYYFNRQLSEIANNLTSVNFKDFKEEAIAEVCRLMTANNINPFEYESKLFNCLIDVIESASKESQSTLKIIAETSISNDEKFYLEAMTRQFYPKHEDFLKLWSEYSSIPKASQDLMNSYIQDNQNKARPS